MDSKFLRVTLLVSFLFLVTIFFVVLYANGVGPGQKKENSRKEDVVQEVVMSGQIGNDLYGWMEDETFFDKAPAAEEVEEGVIRVNLIATSVEKDMRVMVAGPDGKPIEGQFFKIIVNETDEYTMQYQSVTCDEEHIVKICSWGDDVMNYRRLHLEEVTQNNKGENINS